MPADTDALRRRRDGSTADIPPGTLVDLYLDSIREHPDATALVVRRGEAEWEPRTYSQVSEIVRDLSLALRSLGLERGDRAAIISATRYEWALLDFAMVMAGVVSVPVYDSLTADQIAYILRDAGAHAAFVADADQVAKLVEAANQMPDLKHVIPFDPIDTPDVPFELISWESFEARGRGEAHLHDGYEAYARKTSPDDLATLIYTSGTTGPPKGVMLSHDNLFSNTVLASRRLELRRSDMVLAWLPMSHVFERTGGHFCTWHCGAPRAFAESVETVPRDMLEVRPTFMMAVPRFYEKVYDATVAAATSAGGAKERIFWWAKAVGERVADARLAGESPGPWLAFQYRIADRLVFQKLRARTGGRIRYFVSGSAPLSARIAKFFWASGLPVLEGYGLTESSPVISLNPKEAPRLGTVGTPIDGVEVRIAEDGEILCRGRNVMLGYYRNEEATREAIEPDGWLRTGDIGELDQDGYLRITDRKKELIVTSYGKNVAPQPIEETVKRSRLVDQVVLVGDGRKFVVALVVPEFERLAEWGRSEGLDFSRPEELTRQPAAARHLLADMDRELQEFSGYERPKQVILLDEPFTIEAGTLTPTQKVRRKVVAERYAERIDRVYEQAQRELAADSSR
ncbi:MAG: long-chain fatty acid--CoA ligase [Gemmatimonadota bacterium]